ncbi:CopD family protein [Prosthecomicrobium pneumaticum]|uniref:Protoporphyrinogen IX oxidase n=1 Tax=Prosthecomicrobium pneumaticum TaxID=81895 RepID=A0A7W9FKB4_9HYPH|nr:CopD family protein [Prosthecomicrobium pneumaticum]MBB5752365.1 putative membrane protein [Prosthecomicrobium pneumaticum]
MILLKTVHLTTIALWAAALVCLPGLYVQRTRLSDGPTLHRLQATVRFVYVALMSPAAFLAIASGTALIFVREVFAPWFAAKLLLVGLLVMAHVLTGLVIVRLFDERFVYPPWRFVLTTVVTLAIVTGILTLVLAKPDLPDLAPEVLREPGGLSRLVERLTGLPTR